MCVRSLILLVSLLATSPATADIVNGSFDTADGWTEFTTCGLCVVDFPVGSGGDNQAEFIIDAGPLGGIACLTQTFICGEPGDDGICEISFNVSMSGIPINFVPGTGSFVLEIDGGDPVVTIADPTTTQTYTTSTTCGEHTLTFCLQVGQSQEASNPWIAYLDDVVATCETPVANDSDSWSTLKSRY